MPLFMLGWQYTTVFWSDNWYLPVIFFLILGGLNGYFALNWKWFTLLERKDWDGLISHLEEQVYTKKRYRAQPVRILINAYLMKSRTEDIQRLEGRLKEEKQRLRTRFALSLGIPYLLADDPQRMESYFHEFLSKGGKEGPWIIWNYSFALMLQKKTEEARQHLKGLLESNPPVTVHMLTLYLLDAFSPTDEVIAKTVQEGRGELIARFSEKKLQEEIERQRSNLQVVILGKLIQEAKGWLYSEVSAP
jgi:hypothetical protein